MRLLPFQTVMCSQSTSPIMTAPLFWKLKGCTHRALTQIGLNSAEYVRASAATDDPNAYVSTKM